MPDDLESPDDEHAPDNSVIRELRQKADRADAAESRAQQLERELAVHRAGLSSLSEEQREALSAVHKGDWDAEALKGTADRLGFSATTEPPAEETPKVPAEELAAHQRVAEAANGEAPAPPTDLDAAIDAAKTPEELHAVLANVPGLLVDEQ